MCVRTDMSVICERTEMYLENVKSLEFVNFNIAK